MTSSAKGPATLAARAGGSVARRVRTALSSSGADQPGAPRQPASGWLVVSVYREAADLDGAELPAPLAELGDDIEVRVRPAADGKGAELGARIRDRVPKDAAPTRLSGDDRQAELRSALRRAKQLLEVGEVLVVDPAPHGERTPTPSGALLESWTKAAPKAGVR